MNPGKNVLHRLLAVIGRVLGNEAVATSRRRAQLQLSTPFYWVLVSAALLALVTILGV